MNYKTLIIAGTGTIGGSLLRLGTTTLKSFEHVIAIDKSAEKLTLSGMPLSCRQGDIEDLDFLADLFRDIRLPALFVNLCSGVDNVRIRKRISFFDVAYIDSCASGMYQSQEYRFSRLMPYTLTKMNTRRPHWLCWGINPGLVEIVSRNIIKNFSGKDPYFDVSIFEYDRLDADLENLKIAVGWSPEALVEEMMISPSYWVADGKGVEADVRGTQKIMAFWQGKPVSSRVVGHEDIWNIGQMDAINSAEFVYALSPKVMKAFDGDVDDALNMFVVPAADVPVYGIEQVAVRVKGAESGDEEARVWEVDHQTVWCKYGVNAVQYQTSKSILLAISLLQQTHYGKLPLNCCASDLPIGERDWEKIEQVMLELDIRWRDAAALLLHTKPYESNCYVSI